MDLIRHEEPRESNALMISIIEAVNNPEIRVDKMRELWQFKREMDAQAAQDAFNRAMLAAQREMPVIIRDSENEQTHSKYAKLAKIEKLIRPIYMKHGFVITFSSPSSTDTLITVSGKILHEAGHIEPIQLSGPPDMLGAKGNQNKTALHGLGSTVSYLRRYLLTMIFNIVLANEDNDGNKSVEKISQEQLNRLLDLILAAEMDEESREKFLKHMRVERLDDIPERHFVTAEQNLQTKLRSVNRAKEGSK